jgi:UDP-glucose 4-epimerase
LRALVTGGAGFIGSTLVDRLLAEGHTVDVVDDLSTGSLANLAEARADRANDLTFHHVDVCSPELVDLLARRRPEVVFHLASRCRPAESFAQPVVDVESEVVGAVNVLEAARVAEAGKVVHASDGAAIYGDLGPAELPVRESHPQAPVSPHGAAKKAVAEYLRLYRDVHGLEHTALALGHVYGPRQEGDVVAAFATRLLEGEPCTIEGDGAQTRDFVHVDDAVDAFVRAAERGSGLLVNIGTGVETSVTELHRAIAAECGVDRPEVVRAPARTGEVRRCALDPGRAAIHLGWKPWTGLVEGVGSVLRWRRGQS